MKITRSQIVILLILGLAAAFGQALRSGFGTSQDVTFKQIDDLPGWRVVSFSQITKPDGNATNAIFIGIDDDPFDPLSPDEICLKLYTNPGPEPRLAVFTDVQCPNCRSLEAKLFARQDPLSISWIELPLLGPFSEAAARASIAATLLSGIPPEPPRQLRGSGISPVVHFHAARTGLDPEVLNDAIDEPQVKSSLADNQRLASTLGIYGTPAMTIGKTLVIGDVRAQTLDRLLAMDHPACD